MLLLMVANTQQAAMIAGVLNVIETAGVDAVATEIFGRIWYQCRTEESYTKALPVPPVLQLCGPTLGNSNQTRPFRLSIQGVPKSANGSPTRCESN